MSVQSRPLRVAALGMEQRTYNTLQMFFSDRCENHYVLSDENSADIFIIDMDGFQASKVLESHRKKHPHQPAILISVKENVDHDSVFVRKPVQLSVLASALTEAQKHVVRSNTETQTKPQRTEQKIELPPDNNAVLVANPKTTSVNQSAARPQKEVQQVKAQRNESKNLATVKSDSSPSSAQKNVDNKTNNPRVHYFVNTERLKAIQEESRKFLKTFQEQPDRGDKAVKSVPISKSSMEFKHGVNDSGIRFVGDLKASFNPRNPLLISKLQYNAELTLQGYVSLAYKIAKSSSSNVVVEGPCAQYTFCIKPKKSVWKETFATCLHYRPCHLKKKKCQFTVRMKVPTQSFLIKWLFNL